MTEPLLRVDALTKHFPVTRGVLGRVVGQVRAVDGVSFDIAPGETLGLVGESGCGKTTVGRCVLRLVEATSGRVVFDGHDVTAAKPKELTRLRRDLQVIFQDPFSSLNPRMRVVDLIGEALEVHGLASGAEVERRVAELLRRVGLSPTWINRYPHEFSGGQRQRIGVARAIALGPKLVVCDEAVSALDVSIQAQVVNLLIELRREMGLSYLFIAHDLSVVRHLSHRIAVMYLGELVETGPAKRLFETPAHPYTRALLSAIPRPTPRRDGRRLVLTGDVPTPLNPPSGCRFHTRCPAVTDRCRSEKPPSVEVDAGHSVSCVHAEALHDAKDWYGEMSRRIDAATAANEASQPVVSAPSLAPTTGLAATRSTPLRVGPDGAERNVGTKAHQHQTAILAALVLLAVLVYGALSRAERRSAARTQLAELSQELDARQKNTHSLPRDLAELGFRLYPIFDGRRALDPWKRPWRYRTPGSDGRPYDLGSTGPDGVPSADDVGHVPR